MYICIKLIISDMNKPQEQHDFMSAYFGQQSKSSNVEFRNKFHK